MATIKQICGIVTTVAVVAVVILAVLLVGLRLVGLEPFVVLSGSMEPSYPVGSLIYVCRVDTDQLQVGDPITFRLAGETIATHRIIEVLQDTPKSRSFRTQGDANKNPDGKPVPDSKVIGKPIFCIPYLGYLSSYIQRPPGSYVAVGVGLAIIALAFVPDFIQAFEKKNDQNASKDQEDVI